METNELKYSVKNCRMITVKCLPPTNCKGTRVKLSEVHGVDNKTFSKTFRYDYGIDNVMEQAFQILVRNGFHPVARHTAPDKHVILCDDYGDTDTFKYINDLT